MKGYTGGISFYELGVRELGLTCITDPNLSDGAFDAFLQDMTSDVVFLSPDSMLFTPDMTV
jgi:hypothetical protein